MRKISLRWMYLAGMSGLLLLSSCGVHKQAASGPAHPSARSSRQSSATLETDLFQGDFKVAVANIDNNKFLLRDRNKLLYLMEKGKIEYLAGHYSKSNDYFEQAYMMIDDKIKTSVGQGIASKLTNAMAEPYKGEDFEKVTIHYYKALNYFQLGQPNEALVEAKRINIKLLELNDKYKDNKNKYAADAFSQIIQGILYEATGDVNNAFIAYRNAEELYSANSGAYFGVPMPYQLKLDLIRTAKQIGFKQEMAEYQTKFGIAPDPEPVKPTQKVTVNPRTRPVVRRGRGAGNRTTVKPVETPVVVETVVPKDTLKDIGEVIVFWENGLGPVKGQTKITVGGAPGISGAAVNTGDDDLIITIPAGVNIGLTAIAIPKYITRESYYQKASVTLNGTEEFFELSEDYNNIAKQCLKDRMLREALDIALRAATKKTASKGLSMLANQFLGSAASSVTSLTADVVNVATEKADTRNWQTLPATISYLRLPVREGDNAFTIKKYGADGIDEDTIHVAGKPGLQVMSYFDLGRTIVAKN